MTVPRGFEVKLFAGDRTCAILCHVRTIAAGCWSRRRQLQPGRRPDKEAKDRILTSHDADGDGRFDKRPSLWRTHLVSTGKSASEASGSVPPRTCLFEACRSSGRG